MVVGLPHPIPTESRAGKVGLEVRHRFERDHIRLNPARIDGDDEPSGKPDCNPAIVPSPGSELDRLFVNRDHER